MLVFDFAHHIPSIIAGVFVGVIAFAPLLIALVPVLRRRRSANMAIGFVGVIASFLVLFLGVVLARLWARRVFISFATGEVAGFFLCLVATVVVIMRRKDEKKSGTKTGGQGR